MFVCSCCLADEELKAEIRQSKMEHSCDVCGHDVDLRTEGVADLEEYLPFFDDLLRLYEKSDSGKHIVDVIQEDWHIFKTKVAAQCILSYVLAHNALGYSITDKVDYIQDVKECVAVWTRLKFAVRQKSRFFIGSGVFEEFESFEACRHYLEKSADVMEGVTTLYRARISPTEETYSAADMGCPPPELAKAGRANPIGIPYLYLSDSPKTTYFEVRAVYLDYLSVGTFQLSRKLEAVNFAYRPNLYYSFVTDNIPLLEVVKKKKFIEAISKDLSKPLRRADSELEYVATQMICEYCKVILRADAIVFESSLRKNGLNYVLFNQEDAICTDVEAHVIRKIDIDKE